MITRALLALVGLFAVLSGAWAEARAEGLDHRAVAQRIVIAGDALVAEYRPENGPAAGDGFSDLYFNVFEETGLEAEIGLSDAAAKTGIESGFAAVIGLAMKGAPKDKVATAWESMKPLLVSASAKRAEAASGGFVATFLQALLILLREGFEAILVIGALTTYLRRLGAEGGLKVVWRAVGLAVAASLATAWALAELLTLSGAAREGVEGATVLAASLVLAYVSHWLFARREAAKWQGYIRQQVESALSGGKTLSLGFAAFLAVYREGAETVLFYQALAGSAPGQGMAIAAGFAVASVGLAVLYLLLRSASMRLPLGPFFTVTAALLYALAVVFAGQGILELQEARWVPATPLPGLPLLPALGLFPTLETLSAQAVVLALLLPVLGAWVIRRRGAAP